MTVDQQFHTAEACMGDKNGICLVILKMLLTGSGDSHIL